MKRISLRSQMIITVVAMSVFLGSVPGQAELLAQGTKAPDFTLTTLDGAQVKLSDLRGKPVLLEFWATWCGPCRRQFPKMTEVHEKYGSQIHFLLVNTAETAATVRRFGKKVKIPGTVLMDPKDRVGEMYGTTILPSLFFLDAAGTIQAAVPGAVRDMDQFMKDMLEAR